MSKVTKRNIGQEILEGLREIKAWKQSKKKLKVIRRLIIDGGKKTDLYARNSKLNHYKESVVASSDQ